MNWIKLRYILRGFFRVRDTIRDLLLLAIIVGAITGVVALAFYYLLGNISRYILINILGAIPGESTSDGLWYLSPLVVGLGGFVAGILVYTFAPEAEGHGTDAVIGSFHRKSGYMRIREPIVKFIASIMTIGFGGSAGREGPMAQIGGGIASVLSRTLGAPIHVQRIGLTIGLAAGLGAIFKAPLGAAIFAIEVLYMRDFESEALIPAFVGAIVGYSIFGYFTGYEHIFVLPYIPLVSPLEYGFYAILGVATAVVGMLYVKTFYYLKHLFGNLAIPNHFKPMIGGFFTGLIALFFPQILGGGYEWITLYSRGVFPYWMFGKWIYLDIHKNILHVIALSIALIGFKILATSFSIGSGGSGGVFAPGLFIGGLTGFILSLVLTNLFPEVIQDPEKFISTFMIVGMLSLFGGISKAPLAVLIMVNEMVGSYELMPQAMLSIALSYFLTGRLTIYGEQVLNREHSPAHWEHRKIY